MGFPVIDVAALVARVDRLVAAAGSGRVLIGIAGAPGAGKTTLAEALVSALLVHEAPWTAPVRATGGAPTTAAGRVWIGSHVAHVPMDGYHLADIELARLGRSDRKGAPDTYDAAGYEALLARLRTSAQTVWAPGFDRLLEQPLAGAVPVAGAARVVITEGNYLLLDDPAWSGLPELLDEVWFCDLDPAVRLARLTLRHEQFGKSAVAAAAWAAGPDERNASLVARSRERADLVLVGSVPV